MPTIHDEEFGTIVVRKTAKAAQVRIRVAPNGTLRASMPMYAPLFLLKRLLKTSREEIRQMLAQSKPTITYAHGQSIGKSHTLIVREGTPFSLKRAGQQLIATIPSDLSLDTPDIQVALRKEVIALLRLESKKHLPRRLHYLAQTYGFDYKRVRFSHASSRWGSCSSTGTISLNIALMKLPFELIDYVLVHELAHTVEMNHSERFWRLVANGDPDYKKHRALLKAETPSI